MASVGDLANLINQQLQLYSNVLDEDLERIGEELTKEAVNVLKSNSPKRASKSKGYAKKWTVKKVGNRFVIHNKKYQLTHLLEKGHALKGGGRVAARVHIGPVEQDLVVEFEQKVREAAQQ